MAVVTKPLEEGPVWLRVYVNQRNGEVRFVLLVWDRPLPRWTNRRHWALVGYEVATPGWDVSPERMASYR